MAQAKSRVRRKPVRRQPAGSRNPRAEQPGAERPQAERPQAERLAETPSAPGWVIGLAALLLVLRSRPPAAGTVFAGALAAYTLCRQILFRYREEPRRTSLGRRASMIAAGLVLAADIIAAIVAR